MDGWKRALDARIMVWALALVFVSGLPLMLWFKADATAHAAALPGSAVWLRAIHGVATVVLLVGAALHLIVRVATSRAWRHMVTGGFALAMVGAGAVSGVMASQTDTASDLAAAMGFSTFGNQAALIAAVMHVAYTAILTTLALYLHIAHHGLRKIAREPVPLLWCLAVVAVGAWAFGGSLPGGQGGLAGGATLIAPPWPLVWAWSLLLGAAAIAWGLRIKAATRAT